jgi:hypothetical protein
VLDAADVALRTVRAIRCRTSFFGIETFADTAWRARATVTADRIEGQVIPRLQADITVPGTDLVAETLGELCCDGKEAAGIPARTVNLMPRDIETSFGGAGHMVVEAWLADAGWWLFADPQFNAVCTRGGRPLSGVELQAAMARGEEVDFGGGLHGTAADYRSFIGERLCYFRTAVDGRHGAGERDPRQLVLVPAGCPEPRVFERRFALKHCIYTHDAAAFYRAPDTG